LLLEYNFKNKFDSKLWIIKLYIRDSFEIFKYSEKKTDFLFYIKLFIYTITFYKILNQVYFITRKKYDWYLI